MISVMLYVHIMIIQIYGHFGGKMFNREHAFSTNLFLFHIVNFTRGLCDNQIISKSECLFRTHDHGKHSDYQNLIRCVCMNSIMAHGRILHFTFSCGY